MDNLNKTLLELLKNHGITYNSKYTHSSVDIGSDGAWAHDAFLLIFKKKDASTSFKYKQGIGLRVMRDFDTQKIKLSDALYSLICSDALYSDMTHEEFCDTFGYDVDSIKALKIYQDCIDQQICVNSIFSKALQAQIITLLETDY